MVWYGILGFNVPLDTVLMFRNYDALSALTDAETQIDLLPS